MEHRLGEHPLRGEGTEGVDANFGLDEVDAFREQHGDPVRGGIWVEHTILPGDTLELVAARYGTLPEAVAEQNELETSRPRLRAGDTLQVLAKVVPPPLREATHLVRFGDNWRTLAERYGVEERQLRAWNPDVPRAFAAGTILTVYTDGEIAPPSTTPLGVIESTEGLTLMPVPAGSESRGTPNRGRLHHGVQMPQNDSVYTVRRPDYAYGSSHMLHHLQVGLARFREETDYNRELILSDMSRRRGGRYAPHDSHQSGRDVDIWLPCNEKCEPGKPPAAANQIDWDATWGLVKSLIQTGQVQYIFLTRSRQKFLYRAAKRDGLDRVALGDLIQYPRRAQSAIVRHASGHHKHIHVRFHCSTDERNCR